MLIRVENLEKSFSKRKVLNKVSVNIIEGETSCLIGPNGSGKTTLLNILARMISFDSGILDIKDSIKIGASLSRKGFFEDLTVKNQIEMYGQLEQGTSFCYNEAVGLFNIDYDKMRFGQLSAGMKQRVSLTLAFMNSYDLIILDEPTNHLDIDSLLKLKSLIKLRKETGTAFLIASPMTTELERIGDQAIFLINGSVVLNESVKKLQNDFGDLEAAYKTLAQTR